jgi:ATP-dependent exoDNAse (exonuclease V) alpha subunit
LSEAETGELIAKLDLSHPCLGPHDWLTAEASFLELETVRLQVMKDPTTGESIACLQLLDVNVRESKLSRILGKRSETTLPSLNENWQCLLMNAIKEGGGHVNLEDQRHRQALEEQADALERITSRKLSVLVGRAGTGKTTVLGALMKASSLRKDGLLFLAPTGKARVRLAQKAGADAMTVAQFLYSLGRYDGSRQRPLFEGREQYRKEKTVIIDESSMLTLDDLFATLQALDLAHVQRVILVGDPNQLPPIGIGRPFADLVSHLEDSTAQRSGAMAKLTVELRTQAGAPSDLLKLASWYTREIQPVGRSACREIARSESER